MIFYIINFPVVIIEMHPTSCVFENMNIDDTEYTYYHNKTYIYFGY